MRTAVAPAALALSLAALTALPARAESGARAAEQLARARYFDSIPFDAVRALDPEGAARLRELLADPAELEHHAQILEFVGIRGGAGAYEALRAYADRPREGEVDGAVLRARLAVPIALGHLAREDERALADLAAAARADAGVPGWSHGRFRGERLRRQQRSMAVTGLALSGRPQAAALLRRLSSDPELGPHAAAMGELHARIAARGAAAVYRDPYGGDPTR